MRVSEFGLPPGRMIGKKYRVLSKLGAGWEGEVYKVCEIQTGIERAAKLFFPQRNIRDKTAKIYAQKLHKLRQCSLLIQYHTQEQIVFRKTPVTVLISEYVEGILLSDFLDRLPGKRLDPFKALHLLYGLTRGIEEIHLLREYHGDLHTDNVIVNKFGLNFELKLLDLFHIGAFRQENAKDDICGLIRLFYDALGGAERYAKQPETVKYICCGLKQNLILKKFKSSSQLREHIESLDWAV
ncbi:serine/threonine protein kinase [Candidatus Nitromaritima sp. SCGC AAA799-A02]|nr:serine/threonine protein kinase [Candidatus Nitromaritima sp. SCGC AAA799-A02]KMP12205.1 serine/threonine protein kinase [Candidatus Nitromaritima sp. SCGC AAA799-C22]